jgi:hypothetical protein
MMGVAGFELPMTSMSSQSMSSICAELFRLIIERPQTPFQTTQLRKIAFEPEFTIN